MTRLSRRALTLATALLPLAGIPAAKAASWPDRPVRLVVPFPPGGGTDLLAREIAERLSERFPQPFVVENKPGAGAAVGTEYAARATDGHTLLFTSSSHVSVPALKRDLRFDIFEDFRPISLVADQASVLSVGRDVPATDLAELLAHLRANPGRFHYGSAGIGAGQHLSTAYLQQLTGVDIVHVPLKGQGEMITELLGGRIQLGFLVLSTALPYFRSGDIRPIGVATAARSKFAPEIPTIAESGLPGFVSRSWLGLLGPASTPPEVVAALHREIVALADDPSYLAATDKAGMTLVNSTPDELDAEIARGFAQWREVVETARIETGS